MAEIIKLENINRIRGREQFVEEYVCGNCRHLVNPIDTTCWQCGERLEPSGKIEHYQKGKELTDGEFQLRRDGLGL